MKIRAFSIKTTALTCAFALPVTMLAQWAQWTSLGGDGRLSVRTAQNGPTCAIAFRNNSTSLTLVSAKIHYIHSGRTDNDIMVQMGPQQVVGGWTAYSVEDQCGNVEVEIYDQVWR
jgi:hypothetical protein